MSDVYVLGVDMIKFGRFPDRTVPDLGAEAALLALADAELNIGNMEQISSSLQKFQSKTITIQL